MEYIIDSSRDVPVRAKADLCVAGGGCTGVFAAVRAARLGLSVVLCERSNALGGVAVNGLVNIWHAITDMDDRERVIGGLTEEVLCRLDKAGALLLQPLRTERYNFNPSELAIELDRLIIENKITLMLHTLACGVIADEGRVSAILIENNDGRGAIQAKFFIDCTGDGAIARRLNMPLYSLEKRQPPTYCFFIQGDIDNAELRDLIRRHGEEFDLNDSWGWSTRVAGCEGLTMRADNRVFGVKCETAEGLTRAEIEGRRQARAFTQLLRKYGGNSRYSIANLASAIGVRETIHFSTRFQATEMPLLTGARYEAPVLNGTYPVDIHHAIDNGITFKHLDGRRVTVWGKEDRRDEGDWRAEMGVSAPCAAYYQVPFDILVGEQYENFIATGRMLNADAGAFGALRVMVNLNQLGEAAGVAAALCLAEGAALQALDGKLVTKALRMGGSAL